MLLKKLYCSFMVLLFAAALMAQGLPRHLTPEEKTQISSYVEDVKDRSRPSDPPEGTHIRSIAEWEELRGIAISWVHYYRDILKKVVEHASDEGVVYIHCENESTLKDYLIDEGIDISQNVEFIETSYNSIWIRDYGPNSVYLEGADSLVFIDWIYNRPRPQDDHIPSVLGQRLDVPVLSTTQPPNDLVHTGGNYFTDGQGMAFSSKLVLEENGPQNDWGISNHDEADIDRIMNQYMGIDTFVKFDNLPFDIIHHIDMHMKLIDAETLLVGEYPDGIADEPQIEANIQYLLDQFKTVYGREFEVVRIPMPPDDQDQYPDQNGDYRTYTNAVFVNNTVLVPTYEEQYDTTALRIWRELLPGHEIVGINSNLIIPQAGAIHCITKEIGVIKPIWIRHKKLRTEEVEGREEAILQTNVQSALNIDSVVFHYSWTGDEYLTEHQTLTGGDSLWTTDLSLPPEQDSLYYYFSAHASTGKKVHFPLPGKEGAIRLALPDQTATDYFSGKETTVKVYPNPASAITCIEIEQLDANPLEAELYNSIGLEVKRWNIQSVRGMERLFFDAKKFSSGIYFLKIHTKQKQWTRRIVIQSK